MTTVTNKPLLPSTWSKLRPTTQVHVFLLFLEKLLPSSRASLAGVHPTLRSEHYRSRPVGWASSRIVDEFIGTLQTQPADWQIFCELVSKLYPEPDVNPEQPPEPAQPALPDWLVVLPQKVQDKLLAVATEAKLDVTEHWPGFRQQCALSMLDVTALGFAATAIQQMLKEGLLVVPPAVEPPVPVAPVASKLGTIPELVDFPDTLPTVSVLAVLQKWIRDLKCKQIDVTQLLYKQPYTVHELKLYPNCLNQVSGSLLLRLLRNMVTQPTQAELRSADLLTAIAGFLVNGDDLAASAAVKFIAGIKALPEFQRLVKRDDSKVASSQDFEPEDTTA